MTSTAAFIAATTDPDLIRRVQAAAQMAGVPNAPEWALANLARIMLHETSAGPVVDAYAYAHAVRDEHIAATPPPAGSNPAAVTDDMLAEAIEALRPQD